MLDLLRENWLLVAAAAVLAVRTQSANGLVESVLTVLRGVTNTPPPATVNHDLGTDVGRICAAKCLAAQFAARGQTEVADAMRRAIHVLIDEGSGEGTR